MTRTEHFSHLLDSVGFDGLQALVAEGLRRRMTIRQIAKHLNIPMDNVDFFAIGSENLFPLRPGERVRLLTDSIGWRGNGTVIQQEFERVLIRKDGTPPHDSPVAAPQVMAMRYEVALTDEPELLPDGAYYDENGALAIPCKLTPSGKQLTFYCPHCRDWHRHGIPAGYRGAHCSRRDSPLLARGDIYVFPKGH